MRRANKILMATVAILLCLVLITTSVVSGVFARFAIVNKSETEVTFQKFGVNVTVSKNPDQKYKDLVVVETNKKGDSITMAIENIPLNCGSDYSDLIKIKFDGAPTVKVKVSLIFHVNFSYDASSNFISTTKLTVPANAVTGVDAATHFMPLGFRFGANYVDESNNSTTQIANSYIINPWGAPESGTATSTIRTDLEKALRNKISEKVHGFTAETFKMSNSQTTSGSDYGISATFDPNDATTGADVKTNGVHFHPKKDDGTADNSKIINEFVLGFDWPLTWPPEGVTNDTGYNYDELSTYLAQNTDGKPIVFWYTVKIEQE